MSKNLLSQCFIKEGKFKPLSLGGTNEITIRELNISENQNFRKILQDETKTPTDAMYYAVSCAMVEPKFFTEKELEKLNITGSNLIQEVYNEIPLIGKTKKEREEYFEKIKKIIEAQKKETSEKLEDIEVKK